VTGFSALGQKLSAKRLELLREAFPSVSRVAVLWNPSVPGKEMEFKETQVASLALGLQLQVLEIRHQSDLDSTFAASTKGRAHALLTIPDPAHWHVRGQDPERG
jgi:putative ABC transport system substrate-binding protein